jgi:hypothetical protein
MLARNHPEVEDEVVKFQWRPLVKIIWFLIVEEYKNVRFNRMVLEYEKARRIRVGQDAYQRELGVCRT